MKRCSKCKKTKSRNEFYSRRASKDGLTSQCRECCLEYARSPHRKAVQKRYLQSTAGKATQKRYRESEKGKIARKCHAQSEKRKATRKCYRQSAKGKAVTRRYQQSKANETKRKLRRQSEVGKAKEKRYRQSRPERIKATSAVRSAVRVGKLPRVSTQKCHCGEQARHYHHHSYEPKYWLDVKPFCQKCHTSKHQGQKSNLLPAYA